MMGKGGGGLIGGVIRVCQWIVGGIVGLIVGGFVLYYVALITLYGGLMLVQGPAKGTASGDKITSAAWMAAGVVHGSGATRSKAYQDGDKLAAKNAKPAAKAKSAPAKTTKS